MKRDMDLIRKILLEVEKQEKEGVYWPGDKTIEGYDDLHISYHIELLDQGGFIETGKWNLDSKKIFGLTWDGHNFLDAIKPKNKWDRIKKKAAELGGEVTLATILQAIQVIQQQASP